jgi:glycosyltransferase involved in cell wall biosynthesis
VKIAHLVSGGEVAGGQLVALELARGARTAGHEALFVSPSDGDFLRRVRADGFPATVLPEASLNLRSLRALRVLLRCEAVDVLHTHTHFSLNVLGRLAGCAAGARVVAHMHIANVYRSGPSRWVQLALDDATVRLCAAILTVSYATRDALVRQGYPLRRVEVIHNGIALSAIEAPPRPTDLPPHAPLLVLVGRLARVKGQHQLITALALLEDADAVVVLAGKDIEAGGAYRAALERRAEELGVRERVVFTGYRDDVRALLAAAAVVVLPSEIEGLPLVVLEAMAAGRPVVATAVGGTPELVAAGETGLLVRPGDAQALAAALDSLLRDPERRERMGAAARHRVERDFSLDATTAKVLAVYARLAR